MKKVINGVRTWMILALAVGVVLVGAVSWTKAKSDDSTLQKATATRTNSTQGRIASDADWSKAILSVSNMSCGGCVENITKSLAALPGIGKISVDVAAGAADIFFDADKLTNPQQIATAITGAGYPSKIERLVAADKVRIENRQLAERATAHIASVGQLDISRHDFDIELSHARTRYQALYGDAVFSDARGAQVLDQLKAQITSRLISDGIKNQEVARAGYSITPDRVDQSMEAYLNKRQLNMDEFKANLKASGYTFDYFKQKFGQRLLVQSYLEEVVLADGIGQDDRQQRYANWLSNATALAKIIYYDKALEALVKSGSSSGCGGTSCSVASK